MDDKTDVLDAPRHLSDAAAPRRRWRRAGWVAPPVALAVLVGAWALDATRGGVELNVDIAGADVGRVGEHDLPARVAAIARDHADRPVEIRTPGATYRTTAGELGISVDEAATARAALAVGDGTPLPLRPAVWAASFVWGRSVPLVLRVDPILAQRELKELEGDARTTPVEPSLRSVDGNLEVVPGVPGAGLSLDELLAELPLEATSTSAPIQLAMAPITIPPLGTDAAAADAAREAERLTATPLVLTTPAGETTVPVEQLRSWAVLSIGDDGAVGVDFDRELIDEAVRARLRHLEAAPVDARFTVERGQVRIIPSEQGRVCCAEGSPERVMQALRAGAGSVALELSPIEPSFTTAQAEALGIVQEIGSPDAFGPTTHFPCCQPRVQNIHRMADLVRATVIRPGETFSLNGAVGRRTRARGFVEGGVIYDGRFQTAVGGGVSQFATSLFNAALFAGLDIPVYQSHSIHLTRYPRGREATVSYPRPDLRIRNNTPYGVLLWPEYTGTSITVRIFSTAYAQVSIGDAVASPAGRCTRWTTPRTRTFPDGRVVRDSVSALYRPAEGVDC